MPNFFILISDILAVSIMGGVGISGIKYFAYLLREDDLKNLRYIWVPNVFSGGFFFVLLLGLLINDAFGIYLDTPFYFLIHPFLLIGSALFGVSIYRFIKTIKSHEESKKKAQASLAQMQSQITKRLEDERNSANAHHDPTGGKERFPAKDPNLRESK